MCEKSTRETPICTHKIHAVKPHTYTTLLGHMHEHRCVYLCVTERKKQWCLVIEEQACHCWPVGGQGWNVFQSLSFVLALTGCWAAGLTGLTEKQTILIVTLSPQNRSHLLPDCTAAHSYIHSSVYKHSHIHHWQCQRCAVIGHYNDVMDHLHKSVT